MNKDKVYLTVEDLKALAKISIENNKTEVMISVLIAWAEEANDEIVKLRAELDKEKHISNNVTKQ